MNDLRVYRVDGMSCDGCIRAITDAIRKFDPAAFVQVDLWGGTVSVAGAPDENQIRQAIARDGLCGRPKSSWII
jgi:copper chaperone